MDNTHSYALRQDQEDELKDFRSQFYFPHKGGQSRVYLCGNSLGLQPKGAAAKVERILESWRINALDGYVDWDAPWMTYGERFKKPLCDLTGSLPHEVSVMNTLTVNLHLLLCSLYRPTEQRYKILVEVGAFPSDQYAIDSQVQHHGLDPREAVIEIGPRAGERLIREEDVIEAIRDAGAGLALIVMGGINYYTGQFFDLAAITKAAHDVGALAGYDLAHAIGNVPLRLHDWDVDFATWCSYKYLNGGPGAAGGIYIHERYSLDPVIPRLSGWSGSELKTRFQMPRTFIPEPGTDGWALTLPQGLVLGSLEASLELFAQAGLERLRAKSVRLTGYLEYLLSVLPKDAFEIITPHADASRGAQLSVYFYTGGAAVQKALSDAGVVVDYREPGVIRVSPAPLYNSFGDVYRFYEALREALPLTSSVQR